uniref:Exocyst complex component 3 like 1 n=1 Tax=Phasianus colchicus TaxID=9054 RepID=A0A669R519_PHACC
VEKAEKLARGAALKWASGVFYRPEKLEGLGHYRNRETQRNGSIQSRLKSTVQSYLEGVSTGLEQLRSAVQEVQSVCQDMGAARWALLDCADRFQDLQQMRALMAEHVQLASVVQVLPQLFSVHEVFSHTLQLLREQHLLEAHAELMMMEHLRDDILSQLHLRGLSNAQATVLSYFSCLQELNESLAKQLWGIVSSSLQLVREDPVLFVTAIRIIEREEKIDDTLLLDATFLPPGRPKGWRQKFYNVLQETITAAHFNAIRMDAEGPGLARHLAALQRDIVSELRVVKDLMVQCVPAHYNILSVCTATYHRALSGHLQDILREDLDKQALFLLLEWVLRMYPRSAPALQAGNQAVTNTQPLGTLGRLILGLAVVGIHPTGERARVDAEDPGDGPSGLLPVCPACHCRAGGCPALWLTPGTFAPGTFALVACPGPCCSEMWSGSSFPLCSVLSGVQLGADHAESTPKGAMAPDSPPLSFPCTDAE